MKKAFVILLLVSCVLTGCEKTLTAELEQADSSSAVSISADATKPSQNTPLSWDNQEQSNDIVPEITKNTVPTKIEQITTFPNATKPNAPAEQEPPATQLINPKPAPTNPPEPHAADPAITELPITTPPAPHPLATESQKINTKAIEEAAECYAESIGYVYDSSLNKGNSGYYPPEYWPLTSNEEGIEVAIGLLIATTHQLNSRYETEYGDVLIDKFYGHARVNCVVEFSHTDELGNWYFIYILYS